nr:f-box domain containing protein [Colletotrichum truncatum]KAF6794139.1 f-box domain containing protein [Colletotrichum truncatum]
MPRNAGFSTVGKAQWRTRDTRDYKQKLVFEVSVPRLHAQFATITGYGVHSSCLDKFRESWPMDRIEDKAGVAMLLERVFWSASLHRGTIRCRAIESGVERSCGDEDELKNTVHVAKQLAHRQEAGKRTFYQMPTESDVFAIVPLRHLPAAPNDENPFRHAFQQIALTTTMAELPESEVSGVYVSTIKPRKDDPMEYVSGLRLQFRDGSEAMVGYVGEDKNICETPRNFSGFNLTVDSQGITSISIVGESTYVGKQEGSPILLALDNARSLIAQLDGSRIIALLLSREIEP